MIRDRFLVILLQMVGRDESPAEISSATLACQELVPEDIEMVCEAMDWTSAERDLMTLYMVFFHIHGRAPSWAEFQTSLGAHLSRYSSLMTPEQLTAYDSLLAYGFQRLAEALMAASLLQQEGKTAGFKAIRTIKPEESTKPADPEKAKRVQRINQPTPKPPEPLEPEIPKAIQQQTPKKPKAIQPIELELPEPIKPVKPEILPARG